jgi:sugar (pentulose or hexulose) kinase
MVWIKKHFKPLHSDEIGSISGGQTGILTYSQLDSEASLIPVGSEGILAIETFQGSRTPVTDPLARGALLGLTLGHTRGHLWRALLEGVCFGTR